MVAFASCQDLAALQAQIDAIPIEDGSLTKVVGGTNISVTGAGTPSNPYVIRNTAITDGSETKLNGAGIASVTGSGTAVDPYLVTVPAPTGAETKVSAGSNITVTGSGTAADPYVVAGLGAPDGSETKLSAGTGTTVTGSGTVGDPYVLSAIPATGAETKLNGGTNVGVMGSGTAADPYVVGVPTASITVPGAVELATVAEAEAGTDSNRAVTPEGLGAALSSAIADYAAGIRDVFNT